jgi:hypothetical protein
MAIEDAIHDLEDIYGPFGESDGVPEAELKATDERLGVSLPRALRVLYDRTGRCATLHRSHNVLLAPEELILENDRLAFYKEKQNACRWGISLKSSAADDPRVSASYSKDGGATRWVEEFQSISEFLRVQGAWQAILGGLPFSGLVSKPSVAAVAPKESSELGIRVKEAAIRVGREYVAARTTTAWIVHGCVFAMASLDYFGLASGAWERFCLASEELGLRAEDWDYSTVRDA